MFLQFRIAGLTPAAVVGLRNGHLVGELHNHSEHTLLGAPALEGGVRSGGVERHVGILLQELFLWNLGIDLLIQIRAGCSKGCKCCNHYDISFHLNFFWEILSEFDAGSEGEYPRARIIAQALNTRGEARS